MKKFVALFAFAALAFGAVASAQAQGVIPYIPHIHDPEAYYGVSPAPVAPAPRYYAKVPSHKHHYAAPRGQADELVGGPIYMGAPADFYKNPCSEGYRGPFQCGNGN
jgi:hypothetical protein